MKVLHVFNRHRGGGGADNAWGQTVAYAIAQGIDVRTFERDSKMLGDGLSGKAKAFFAGIYSCSAVRAFGELLHDFKPDIVHAHELMPLVTPWILPLCTKAKVPVAYTYYDFRLSCPVYTHYRQGELCHQCEGGREYRAVMNNCRGNYAESAAYAVWNTVARVFDLHKSHVAQFIVISEFGKAWLQGQGIGDRRISIIPCAVPQQDAPVDPPQGQYIAYAGRFVEEKGIGVLIQAARKTGLPVKLAGNYLDHPGILPGDPVECADIQSKAELAAFYRGARLLVMPSIWYETFGIVAAEAMSYGVPVLASRIGALQYTVEDGVSGLLFEANNADDLAEKMGRLWHDDQLARKLGRQAFESANRRFNPALCFDLHLAAYESAKHNAVNLGQ